MPTIPVSYHRVTPADASLFDNIAPEVFDEPVHPERVRAYLANPNSLLLLAVAETESGKLVVGQCMGVVNMHPDKPNDLFVDEVGVTPAYHRQGIAETLMQQMFAWGRERGCVEAWVGTELDNEPAKGLYRKLGASMQQIAFFEWGL